VFISYVSCFIEFREAFKAFDRDNNGFITTKELSNILRSLGLNPTEKQICELVSKVDFDGKRDTKMTHLFLISNVVQ